MKLKLDNRKTKIDIKSIIFKEEGVIITTDSGDSDFYKFSWLSKQNTEVTKE